VESTKVSSVNKGGIEYRCQAERKGFAVVVENSVGAITAVNVGVFLCMGDFIMKRCMLCGKFKKCLVICEDCFNEVLNKDAYEDAITPLPK